MLNVKPPVGLVKFTSAFGRWLEVARQGRHHSCASRQHFVHPWSDPGGRAGDRVLADYSLRSEPFNQQRWCWDLSLDRLQQRAADWSVDEWICLQQ